MSLVARNRKRKRRDIRRVVYATAAGVLCTGTMVAAHSYTLVRDSLREEECNEITLGANTTVHERTGRLLSTIAAEQNRQPVRFDRFPKHLVDATISIEDKRFFDHDGIDYNRIIGAAYRDLTNGEGGRQGGSTITMQLMKNLCHPTEPRTVELKLVEAYSANGYEKTHTKQEILTRYLNSVFLGNFAVGVQAASLTYFDRDVSKITLAQAALLAGLPQAPSQYNPFKNPQAAKERRDLVLAEMARDGKITQEQSKKAQSQGLGLKRGNHFGFKAEGFWVDYVENQLVSMYGRQVTTNKKGKKVVRVNRAKGRSKVRSAGLRVHTTINSRFQSHARAVLRNRMGDNPNGPAAAIAMLDVKTGRILTMASTARYSSTNRFNLAGPEAKRAAGSTFKTFVLTAMINQGVSPSTRYYSTSPIFIDGSKCADPGVGSDDFKTFGGKGGGMMDLVRATTASDNSAYVQMTCDIGPQAVYDMARKMGIRSMVNGIDNHNLSLGLGGLNRGVNVLEMAQAYATLANGGFYVKPMAINRIVSPNGKVRKIKPQRRRIFSEAVAYEVTKILRRNVQAGTGTTANLPNVPVAGKTGTVDNSTDGWFVAYTPRYVTAVWVGYPKTRTPIGGLTGGGLPASIWRDFMNFVTEGESNQAFREPATAMVWSDFDGYYQGRSAALAAAAAEKARKEAEDKAKQEEDDDKPDKPDTPDPPDPGGGGDGGGGTPPPGGGGGGGNTPPAGN